MKKFKIKLLLLLSIFLLVGCKEKAPPTISQDEKMAMIDCFSEEYKNTNVFELLDINEMDDATDNFYNPEKIIVEVSSYFDNWNQYETFEIFCYYDKKLRKWQYTGSQSLRVYELLKIRGTWGFEVFPGFFQKTFDGGMLISEIEDNKAYICVSASDNKDVYFVDGHWYDIHRISKEDGPKYIINDVLVIDYEDRSLKNIFYRIEITQDEIIAYNVQYYEKSKMKRDS